YTTGSLGALELIFNKLIDHNNRTMIGIGPQFVEAVSEFTLVGGKYQSINMFDYQNESDLFGVLASKISSQNPALVYIDNPNNPTGRIYDRAYLVEIARVCERSGAILIVDEAYGEYLPPEQS
ncbi:aminotransferase class I/II-fold pyridoxal phosphate-dependent enzyme, partial [Vibrio sp. 10N.222.48.A8]